MAKAEVSYSPETREIKVVVPRLQVNVMNRAIQVFPMPLGASSAATKLWSRNLAPSTISIGWWGR